MILRENWDIMIHRYIANGEGVLHPVILEGWKKRVTFFLWSLRLLIQIWQNKQKSEKSKLRHKSSRESGEEDSWHRSVVLKEYMPMISKSKLKGAQWTLVNGDANAIPPIFIFMAIWFICWFFHRITRGLLLFSNKHTPHTLIYHSWRDFLGHLQSHNDIIGLHIAFRSCAVLFLPWFILIYSIQMAYFAKCFSFFAIFKWIHIFTV